MATVNPTFDSEGNYAGSEIVGERPTLHNGSLPGWENDISVDNNGINHHIAERLGLGQEEESGFNAFEYQDTCLDTYPDLKPAVAFFSQDPSSLPPELMDEWNQVVNDPNMDTDRFHQLAEFLMESYADQHEADHQPNVQSDEEWFDANYDEESYSEELETLSNVEYTTDQAEVFANAASGYDRGSAEFAILSSGVDIAFGKAEFGDIYSQLEAQFGKARLASAYNQLVKTLN
jgi:hypothetical protein